MEPSTFKVSSLVEKCVKGELLLPEIQRSFVWKQPQIRDLIDSLYHDYPTGTILAWETDDPPKARPIGKTLGQKTGQVELLILDGQQRLTALLAVFENGLSGRQVDIRFSLESERFEVANTSTTKQLSAKAERFESH